MAVRGRGCAGSWEVVMVKSGEVWIVESAASQLKAVVACGDLLDGSGEKLMGFLKVQGMSPDMVYGDPPWTSGIQTMFRGQAGDMNVLGDRKDRNLTTFFVAMMRHLRAIDVKSLYLEMGVKHLEDMVEFAKRNNLSERERWAITYSGKKPAWLVRFGDTLKLEGTATGMSDVQTPKWAIERESSKWVYDPCLGQGGTSMCAILAGSNSIGLELVPKRASVAVDRIVDKIDGAIARKLGSL